MEYLLERKVTINRNTKHKSLYSWCLNEYDENNSLIKRDLIPFEWRFWFTGQTLKLSNNLSIELNKKTHQNQATKQKAIYGVFKSGICRDDENISDIVTFSIFGTKRTLTEFSVTINEVSDSGEETCWLHAFPSYVSEEAEFREIIEPDYAGFNISLRPEKFNALTKLIENRSIDSIRLSVKGIDGMYADWTPTIKTRSAKILTSNNIIEGVDLNSFEGSCVGKVGEFDIIFLTHASLNYKQVAPSNEFTNAFEFEEIEDDASVNFQKNKKNTEASQEITQVIKSLKTVLWFIFFALLFILLK